VRKWPHHWDASAWVENRQHLCQVVRFNTSRRHQTPIPRLDTFHSKDYVRRTTSVNIKKTVDTRMAKDDFARWSRHPKHLGMPVPHPSTRQSVDLCCELGIPILKIASSDLNDWLRAGKIAKTKKPVIVSTGGSSAKDLDDLVDVLP